MGIPFPGTGHVKTAAQSLIFKIRYYNFLITTVIPSIGEFSFTYQP